MTASYKANGQVENRCVGDKLQVIGRSYVLVLRGILALLAGGQRGQTREIGPKITIVGNIYLQKWKLIPK